MANGAIVSSIKAQLLWQDLLQIWNQTALKTYGKSFHSTDLYHRNHRVKNLPTRFCRSTLPPDKIFVSSIFGESDGLIFSRAIHLYMQQKNKA